MGNNHEKFFSKEKRKLLILGLNGVGKSCINTLSILALIKTISKNSY